MQSKLTRIDIASWCGFVILACSTLVTPLCLPEISKTLGTNFAEGGALETARTLVAILVLVLAGIFSGRWGKKFFLTLGQYLLVAGLVFTSLAKDYGMLVLGLVVIGLGSGLTEALLNPLVADLHPDAPGKYLNLSNAFFCIGVLCVSLIFGELLTAGFNWRWIFIIAAAGAACAGLFFNVLRFPPTRPETIPAARVIAGILRQPVFWIFGLAIFIGGGVEAAFTFWSRSYVTTYMEELPRAGTFAVMLFAAAMAVGRLFSSRIAHKISLYTLMLVSALLGTLVSLAVPFTTSLVLLYLWMVLAGFAVACLWPTILAAAGQALPENSTLLFVLLACLGAAGFGTVPLVMGIIGDWSGLQAGFWLLPVLFLALIGVLCITKRMTGKRRGEIG